MTFDFPMLGRFWKRKDFLPRRYRGEMVCFMATVGVFFYLNQAVNDFSSNELEDTEKYLGDVIDKVLKSDRYHYGLRYYNSRSPYFLKEGDNVYPYKQELNDDELLLLFDTSDENSDLVRFTDRLNRVLVDEDDENSLILEVEGLTILTDKDEAENAREEAYEMGYTGVHKFNKETTTL